MSATACYLFLKDKESKDIFCASFLDMNMMQLKFDKIFEVCMLGCSYSVFTEEDDDHAGVCYIECCSHTAYIAMRSLLYEVLYDYNFDLVEKDEYCCDTEFLKGFVLWQVE